ncbi:APC family permease [Pseudarthrobacter sp. NamE5]|uniref:APC family permease n=1 Tax=Pseudarthrobacter sp. NamE5 TaxID=2576839 RepID=UPI00110B561B|nr:APC family permease [Pseudarthrobacter sp. NamE5]TLM88167.1 APC family permease [Pseudarthrobacter sp. NamE5]
MSSASDTRAPLEGNRQSPEAAGSGWRRVLGVPSLVLLGLVYMVPLTIFSTYGIVVELTGGRLSAAYAAALVVMLFTARSYGRMAKAFPFGGSAYTYATRSFGAGFGFLAGWSLLLDYLLLPMINYLLIGIYLNAAFPAVPAWLFIVVSIVAVTVLNLVGITAVARANYVVVGLQGLFIVLFVVLACVSISGSGAVDLLAPFRGADGAEGLPPIMAGAAILCLSYLGFDAVSTFAEEAKDPRRTIPKAIMLTTVLAGLIFLALAYISHQLLPVGTFASPDSAAIEVVGAAGGNLLVAFFTAAYIAGSLGSALTSQASVSRIIHSMGRGRVLPAVLGRLHPRLGTPAVPIILTSAVALLALVLDLTTVTSLISFGALVAFSVVNVSVIKHHFIDENQRGPKGVVNNLLLPGAGLILTVWLWTSLSGLSFSLGLSWAALGLVYLAVLTRGFRRPTPDLELEAA